MAIHTRRQLNDMVDMYITGLVKNGYIIDSKENNKTILFAPIRNGNIKVSVFVYDNSDKYQMISETEVLNSYYPIKTHRLTAYHAYNDLYADSIEEAKSVCHRR